MTSPIQPTLSVEFAESHATSNSDTLSRNLGEQTAVASLVTIQQAPSVEFVQALARRFTLGWSHYVELLTIDSPDERRFYEIEAAANQWSVRELRRQIDSSLYQRLALSRDKDEVRRLATEGQVVEKAADLVCAINPQMRKHGKRPITLITPCGRLKVLRQRLFDASVTSKATRSSTLF